MFEARYNTLELPRGKCQTRGNFQIPMGKLYNNIVETVGRTPLVKLNKVPASLGVDPSTTIALKCEFFNPLGSVKDRIGMSMIEDAEQRGVINKDTVIIEPTSGNTGIALAFVA